MKITAVSVRAIDGISSVTIPSEDQLAMEVKHIVEHARWVKRHRRQAAKSRNAYDTSVYIPQWSAKRLTPRQTRSAKVGRFIRRVTRWKAA